MEAHQTRATGFAILAAVLYAINIPASKALLAKVEPMMMASLLYLGAGIGIGILYLAQKRSRVPVEGRPLTRQEFPYVLGMIILDIIAPILLMFGLRNTSAANASLLNNFEIAATSLIALVFFREKISKNLWAAIGLVTLASILLSFKDITNLHFEFSWGALLVLLAAVAWGFENNCTRMLSGNNTFVIVILKGLFSGLGSLIVAKVNGESLPALAYIFIVLILGFFAYGLSIFFYIKAQHTLGAAKTAAWYAIAPFVGALLSFVFLHEALTPGYLVALLIMLAGSALVVRDTMVQEK